MESVTMAKVFIYPANNHENQYINIQEKAIKRAGVDVTYSLKELFSTDFLLLNWFETLGGNPKLDYLKKWRRKALRTIKMYVIDMKKY